MEVKAVSTQVVSCCVYDKSKRIMQHMHGNIPYLFDLCADPCVHLLLLKSFMGELLLCNQCDQKKIAKIAIKVAQK